MHKFKHFTIIVIVIFARLHIPILKASKIIPKTSSSSLTLKSGTTFYLQKPITSYIGTIIKEDGANLEGEYIYFDGGTYEENKNKMSLTGKLTSDATSKICLVGNKTLRAKRGQLIQIVEISGLNNKIDGTLFTNNDITIQDETSSVTLSLFNALPVNIQLNNGTIFLEEDLHFASDKKITGSGTIKLNNYKLNFGVDDLIWEYPLYFDNGSRIEINSTTQLDSSWTFSGNNNVLSCHENIISLGASGNIIVEKGSQLTIKNAILIGISGTNLRCLDNNGKIIFNNVIMLPNANCSFNSGKIEILDTLEINGPYTFAYQSSMTSTIKSNSELILDGQITFSYDPNSESKNLIAFEDATASLILKNGTLHTTVTGLQLTLGNLFVKNNAYLVAEKQTFTHDSNGDPCIHDNGITFGNDNADYDLYCKIENGSSLDLKTGSLYYKNVNSSSWKMEGKNSEINIYSYATLRLHQTLELNTGKVNFYQNATLEKNSNKFLLGPINKIRVLKQ